MIRDKFIICYSGTTWEMPWGISQRLMERFSARNKVLYIEYQPSFLHYHIGCLAHAKYNSSAMGGYRTVNSNLRIFSPKIGLPFNNYFRNINIFNQRRIANAINREIKKEDPEGVIMWGMVPYAVDFIKNIEKFFTVYHCGGNYSVEKSNVLRMKNVSEMENELIQAADLVIGQTRSLCDRFGRFHKKTFYFPSAIDSEYFSKNMSIKCADLANIKRPRIGITGYFDDDFYDIGLLKHLMEERREWSFVFIGPITGKAAAFAALRRNPNAYFLGYKSPEQLPGCIKDMDLGIIPYNVNDYIREVSPTKVYEYMACGKPVVSVEIPDISRFNGVVRIGYNRQEFLMHMDNLLSSPAIRDVSERAFEISKQNSISHYIEKLSDVIEEMLAVKSETMNKTGRRE